MQKKEIKDRVVVTVTKLRGYGKGIVIVLASLLLIYGLIYLFTKKERMPQELKTTIDSLVKANVELTKKQEILDSVINVYESKVDIVNHKIDNIKEKTIIIREYYHKQIQAVNNYTPTEVEGFFKHRYNY
tara:strand:- start:87 stop:476 length:390 start_codon:yes stop_codon:yes gene_type:complete